MTSEKLTISFEDVAVTDEVDYWAVLQNAEDHSDDQAVSYSDAASVIDDLFDIEPCTLDESAVAITGGEVTEVEEASDFESYQEKITDAFIKVLPSNYFGKSGHEYTAVVEIYLSDPDRPYKLNLNNGTILSTKTVTRKVYKAQVLDSDDEGKMSVDYPIIEGLTANFSIKSNTTDEIVFADEDNVTNEIVEVEYYTTYDEVKIQIHEEDDDFGECLCLLFYQKNVETLTISYTKTNSLISSAISDEEDEIEEIEEEIVETDICYLRQIDRTACRCFPYYYKDSEETLLEVPCSTPGSSIYPAGAEATVIDGYIKCDGENWEGANDDFFTENCCDSPGERVLPTCLRYKQVNYGGKEIIKGFDFYIENALTNETVAFAPVDPKDGICGDIINIFEVNPLPCCDDENYEDLNVDWSESADIIAPGSYAYIYWTGGLDTVTVTISGTGFYLDEDMTVRSATVEGKGIAVYTNYASCGTANITITDGCTTATAGLAGTEGSWNNDGYLEVGEDQTAEEAFNEYIESLGREPDTGWAYLWDNGLDFRIGTIIGTPGNRIISPMEVLSSQYFDYPSSQPEWSDSPCSWLDDGTMEWGTCWEYIIVDPDPDVDDDEYSICTYVPSQPKEKNYVGLSMPVDWMNQLLFDKYGDDHYPRWRNCDSPFLFKKVFEEARTIEGVPYPEEGEIIKVNHLGAYKENWGC